MIALTVIAILVGGSLGAGFVVHVIDSCRPWHARRSPPTARALRRMYKAQRADLSEARRRGWL